MTQFLNGCFSHMTLRFHFKFYHSKNGQERPILNYRMSNGRAIGISKHLKTGPFDIWLSKHPVFGSPKYTCKNSYHVGCCLGEWDRTFRELANKCKNSYHVGCCLGEWGRTFRELANKVRHFLHRYIVSTVSLTVKDKFNKKIRIVIMLNNISLFVWKLTLEWGPEL